jgi:hypothetical protein
MGRHGPLVLIGGDMSILSGLLGAALILIILGDAFETIVLPRRVTRRISLARLFYRSTWLFWRNTVRLIFSKKRQENFLSWYGPLSLLLLLILWATGLVIGFGLVHWSSGSTLKTSGDTAGLSTYLYLSGTTFFTLGLGDIVPNTSIGRGIISFEAGMGFGFLALVIGYLPALNQSFARREVNISLLDGKAGSPPTAGEMLRRHSHDRGLEELQQLFHEWENWSADLLESHLSYPVLAYFRSQHENQSWLGALAAVLDASAFVIASVEGACERQAQLTFAMTRHTIVDLAQVLDCPPHKPKHDRLGPAELTSLRKTLVSVGFRLREGGKVDQTLIELREMYEPYLDSLSNYLNIPVPPWIPKSESIDSWQRSAWGRNKGFKIDGLRGEGNDEHF